MAVLGTLFVAAAGALVLTIYFSGRDLGAPVPSLVASASPKLTASQQGTPSPRPAPQQLAQASPSGGSPPSVRTETITYGEWTVACRYTDKKVCSATLPMVLQEQNQNVEVGGWIIAHNNQGALLSVLQTPQINVGVLIAKGIELKLGNNRPHHINYVVCGPRRCEASLPMDEALIRESIAAANSAASITLWKSDGTAFTINIASIRGIDKAIAAVR